MRRIMVVLLLALCTSLFLHPDVSAKRRPFIRGVFVAGWPMCFPTNLDSTYWDTVCCPAYVYPVERNLFYSDPDPTQTLHANNIMGWEYPERTWMDDICNESDGAVKKWSGYSPNLIDAAWNWQSQSWRNNVISDAQSQYESWGQDIGLSGLFVGHEVHPQQGHTISEYYPGFDYMSRVADSLDPNPPRYTTMIMTSVLITPGFSDSVTHLDYVETELYPFGSTTLPSGQSFQNAVDNAVNEANKYMNWFKDKPGSWIANFQVSAWDEGWFGGTPFGGYCDHDLRKWMRDTSYPESLQARYPSREEMRLLAFLAISRGSKGVRTFAYSPGISLYTMDWGLLDFRHRVIFHPRNDEQSPADSNYYPSELRYNYPVDSDPPFYHVAELYQDLEPHDDLFTNLYVTAAGSFRQNRDSTVTFIKGVRCSDSAQVVPPGYWWEVSTFTDTATVNNADYFMLLNRITCDSGIANWQPAGYRTCDVIFTRPVGYAPVIQDVFSNEIWFLTQPDNPDSMGYSWWTFTDSVGPGDGEIYRVTDVFTGPVTGNVTLANDAILTRDLVITSTGTLTINPGVDIYVYPDTDAYNQGNYPDLVEIICRGGGHLNAAGTASDSVRFIPWQSQEPGDWGGIYIDLNGHCDLDYCSIRYASTGLEARNYADISVSHSDISHNSATGIYCYKADLNLQRSPDR